MIPVRKIEMGCAREFRNIGKNYGEILKTRRNRSESYDDAVIDVRSILHKQPSLKPPVKPNVTTLRRARFGARDEQLVRPPVTWTSGFRAMDCGRSLAP